MIKQNNRRSELAMREMELWSSIAMEKGMEYDLSRADGLWKELLLHQFHDILPGSSIAKVYVEAEEAHHALQASAEEMKEKALAALTKQMDGQAVTVWNSLSFERQALVELPERFRKGARTLVGEDVPVQTMDGKVKALVTIPSCGAISLVPTGEPINRAVLRRRMLERIAAQKVKVPQPKSVPLRPQRALCWRTARSKLSSTRWAR